MRFVATTLICLAHLITSTVALGSQCSAPLGSGTAAVGAPYWLESMPHVGTAAFNPTPSTYKVYRNVKDYGAIGDGVADDTAAINAAIADQNRCGLGCKSSTTTAGLVYFPPGQYLVTTPIIPFYYTALVGDAKNRPTIVAASNFNGFAVIDADPYIPGGGGAQYWVNQNNFFRAIRGINLDLTRIPPSVPANGIHWQVSQATSLSFVKVTMSQDPSVVHAGLFMENGSGGVMSDLEFIGGGTSVIVGNQQFTVRNAKFSNAKIAIQAIWNWGWTWQNIQIANCGVGIEMATGGTTSDTQTVGSEVLVDFTVSDTPIFVRTSTAQSTFAGSIYIDNAKLTNVPIAVGTKAGATVLAGGTKTIVSWAQGKIYSGSQSTGQYVQSNITPPSKPASLLDSTGKIYGSGRPLYESYSTDQFVSVKAKGAKGDGIQDDTAALQAIFDQYAGCKIIFFDAGSYVISDTLNIPVGTDMIGEMWSQILIKGTAFNDVNNPKVALKFGNAGDVGTLKVTDIVISTVAGSSGAIATEVNIQASSQGSVGFWDTHVRLGGSKGTGLTTSECVKLQNHGMECSSAFLSMHITTGASAYLENVWLWNADHTLDDDPQETQIDVFSGRGILVEGTDIWLVGTGSEHHLFYQYRFHGAKNVYAGIIQTETPYFQPSPAAPSPFPVSAAFKDPDVSVTGSALALSIESSSDILIYGAGLYSFFRAYAQTCLDTKNCQAEIATVSDSTSVNIYSLSTVAVTYQLVYNGQQTINQSANINGFASTVTAWSSDTLSVSAEVNITARKRSRKHRRALPLRLASEH
ncbi:glycoside hydrolase family 55 protein [Serendipita vermifera MAFF 305830]|uniref:Glycoside hydrolase family 55 protein n=1 Tax=Serendipita vermifera MAFF 305830 TaxID=933852 RepID=A0A0C2X831_SERVB|nr:glycoside hydrolase family 55 protein [Serendipita vermifera MAFF 305830]